MKSLRFTYAEFGVPADVLRLEKVTIDRGPAADEVLLELIASPVHPSDMGMICGKYGRLPQLPAVGGREGIGRIIDTGSNCKDLLGKIARYPCGAWQSLALTGADGLYFVPDSIDVYQAAMAFINPLTAWMILHAIRDLKAGDWVMQNASNSAVGTALIQIANAMGVRTINLVRSGDVRRQKLMSRGATLVFDDETFDPKSLAAHTGGKLPILGLNSVGGNSAMNIVRCMAEGGEVVTIGGMVSDKVRFPTREMIFSGVLLRGFWLDKWTQSQSHEKMQSMYDIIFDLIGSGTISIPIGGIVSLSDGPAALLAALGGEKEGKILLVP
ncbi:MAG: 2-enoyl thioester reductase domain-containing protein [Puniceicoccales bacterium]|nr:2-enoyl thioester reductase domain-containing protein [Puniceicoccales bacterium]